MYLLDSVNEVLFGVSAVSANSGLFKTLENASNFAVGLIKWAALLYLVFEIARLGFKITSTAKDGTAAIELVKEKGVALLIGTFVVVGCFMIQGAIEDSIKAVGTSTGKPVTGATKPGANTSGLIF